MQLLVPVALLLLLLCCSPAAFALVQPIAYSEIRTFVETYDGFQLPALLIVPEQQHPNSIAAVFIHGSGPGDENETSSMNHAMTTPPYYQSLTFAPFADLAHGLAQAGFTSIRYEKRSHFCGRNYTGCLATGLINRLTLPDFENDAVSAAKLLQTHPHGINVSAVAAVGHSEGCLLAPRVAKRVPGARWVALMHGAYASFDLVDNTQQKAVQQKYKDMLTYLLTLEQSPQVIQAEKVFENTIAALDENMKNCTRFYQEYLATGGHVSPDTFANTPTSCTNTEITTMLEYSQWANQTNTFIAAAQTQLELHVLAVNGPHDWNIPPEHYTAMHKWLVSVGFANFGTSAATLLIPTLVEVPGVNHWMVPNSLLGGHVVDAEVQALANFLRNGIAFPPDVPPPTPTPSPHPTPRPTPSHAPATVPVATSLALALSALSFVLLCVVVFVQCHLCARVRRAEGDKAAINMSAPLLGTA